MDGLAWITSGMDSDVEATLVPSVVETLEGVIEEVIELEGEIE